MSQVHYEVYIRKPGSTAWALDLATEDRARALEACDEAVASGKAHAARVSKETLDPETREFHSVVIVTKGVRSVICRWMPLSRCQSGLPDERTGG